VRVEDLQELLVGADVCALALCVVFYLFRSNLCGLGHSS
jgi:hypothetical protein